MSRRNTLLVLMWKHFKVRGRRYLRTASELLSPILLFLVLFLLRDKIKPSSKHVTTMEDRVIQPEAYRLEDAIAPRSIYYYPKSSIIDQIMDNAGEKLQLRRYSSLPGTMSKGYYGIESEEEFVNIAENLGLDEAIVIFQNVNGSSEYPRKLNYTIRMRENFLTHIYEALDDSDIRRPHENFGMHGGVLDKVFHSRRVDTKKDKIAALLQKKLKTAQGAIYESFMRVQWAIDSTYLEMLTASPIKQRLTFQEFPYTDRDAGPEMIVLIMGIITLVCIFSLMLMFIFLLTGLLEERTNGIQELIKMVGATPTTLSLSHALAAAPCGVVYAVGGTLLLTCSSNPLVEHTAPPLICVALSLHVATVIAMAFACSYIVRSTNYAASISFTAYTLLFLPYRLLPRRIRSRTLLHLTGLLPHEPLDWFWAHVGHAEFTREAASLTEGGGAGAGRLSILSAYGYMVVQIVLYSALSWYLEKVRPGKYGVAQPWNFLFQRSYWCPQKVRPDASLLDEEESQHEHKDPRYFEEPPSDMHAGIKVVNVSKDFGAWPQPRTRVLHNVNLDIYKGEITVLLGHNGAGKTTLMSIITGMYACSGGDVYVNGLHTVRQKRQLHKHVGLCPQHNLFFTDLTVLEHVMFFTMLKGASYKEARSASLDLLDKLGLKDKRNSSVKELSGGMKRRLQLTCALAGGADVLVLDEPTSGLDVETRRELWDLLLSLRGERTVLLTTHFMEEADALGDRVAVLHHGRLKCHATPMFLKKSIGSGYRLTLVTETAPDEPAVTRVVTSHVPDAALTSHTINSLSYTLPASQTDHYPPLFNALEADKAQLGITSIGVGVSTLEEVFLQLCRDVDNVTGDDETDSMAPEPLYKKMKGHTLWLSLFVVLFKRQFKYTYSKFLVFLLFQLALPLAMIYLFTRNANNSAVDRTRRNSITTMNLDMFADMSDRPKAFYNVNVSTPTAANFRRVADHYPAVEFTRAPGNIADDILRMGKENKREYNKYLIGLELNDTDAKVLYTTTVRHTAPIALNLLTNVLASNTLPWADGRTVTTSNHPVQGTFMMMENKFTMPKSQENEVSFALVIAIVLMSIKMNVTTLPCQERKSGARHIHIMTGCPPALYWLTTLAYNMLVYVVTLAVPTVIFAAILDHDHTNDDSHFLIALFTTLVCGAASFFAVAYLVSFFKEERGASLIMVILVFLCGLLVPVLVSGREFLRDETEPRHAALDVLIACLGYIVPMQNFTMALLKATNVARLNAYCRLNKDSCPKLVVQDVGFDAVKCCATPSGEWLDQFSFGEFTPASYILTMFLQAIAYMVLVVLAQYGVFNQCWDRAWNRILYKYNAPAPPDAPLDGHVRAEQEYVDKVIKQPLNEISDAMLVHDLHKNYHRCLRRNVNAVQGIDFSVKKGECFGLLGVNGAGKSTTFKMLTGEEEPTRGRVFANGYMLHRDKFKYIWTLGYCPQFFGLDQFLTGRENLTLMLTLRGLSGDDVTKEVKQWISIVGLEKYADSRVSTYSGGCVRRLAAAAGLSRGAPLSLLDEPTAGVDPAARRRVWHALRRSQRNNRSIIITSHSMDEMEALCHRIAIMHGGRVVALGTVSALRAAHAAGHAVILKLRHADSQTASDSEAEVQRLRTFMHDNFNCTLKDEHKTMLHYHINETIPYSQLFSKMQELKSTMTLVEDYSVTETTLEEVFLSLARDPAPQSTTPGTAPPAAAIQPV